MFGWIVAAALAISAPVTAPACPGHPSAPLVSPVVAVRSGPGVHLGAIRYAQSVPLADHQLALTFDDGPDGEHTGQVLDILDRHCIKATFFLVGQEVEADPAAVRNIALRGHQIGAHSYTHPDSMAALPLAEARAEIDRSEEALQRVMQTAPPASQARLTHFFRFPAMIDSPDLLAETDRRGLASMSADYGFDDWVDDIPPDRLYDLALTLTEERKKGVILLHDYNPNMIAMLDRLLTALEARGYHFVQLTEARP